MERSNLSEMDSDTSPGLQSGPLVPHDPQPISSATMIPTPTISNAPTERASFHPVPSAFSMYDPTEIEDLPDTRKRRKLSEYAHLEQMHQYRTQQAFSKLQHESSMDMIGDITASEAQNSGNASQRQTSMLEDDEDVDITGSGEDGDVDGHLVLSAQWQAQREHVRKKRKRKSFPFTEPRKPQAEPLGFSSPTGRFPTTSVSEDPNDDSTSPTGKAHPKMQISFGSRHSRFHSSRSGRTEDSDSSEDIDLIGEDGVEVESSKDLYVSTNMKMTKSPEEGEDVIADIVDDEVAPNTSRTLPPGDYTPTSPPRVKLVLGRQSDPAFKTPAPLARRSSRLNAVNVTEYEYDVEAPSPEKLRNNYNSHTSLPLASPTTELHLSKSLPVTPLNQHTGEPGASTKKKPPKSLPPKRTKSSPRSAIASPVRQKLDHGIVTNQDINDFYLSLQPTHYQKRASQPKGMVPVLFSYQLRALSWMMERESKEWMRDGVRGGILADEMGLGKTIEMMGLIISNPRSLFLKPQETHRSSSSIKPEAAFAMKSSTSSSTTEDATPPSSASSEIGPLPASVPAELPSFRLFLSMSEYVDPPLDRYDSATSLIVCPDILLPQWQEEMKRHAPSLSVHTYSGMPNMTALEKAMYSNGDMFSFYDVVLCSYETLAKEFPYATKPNVKTRNQQEQPSTPMTKLRWWRIIMDEAQMFSQGASNAGKLLRHLSSVNRWAVSGTPIRKDFTDLKGLLLFLDCEDQYHRPTPAALAFIRQISWRHQMEQVSDEIIIPPAETHVLEVGLNSMETFGASKLATKLKFPPNYFTIQGKESPKDLGEVQGSTMDALGVSSEAILDSTSFPMVEILSLKTGKYSSCPYQVLLDKCMEQKAILPHADRLLLSRSLATYISSEFYSSQLAVCQAINSYGDTMLLKAKRLRSLPEMSAAQQALFDSLVTQATALYQKSLDLVMYKTGTEIYSKLVLLRTPHFVLGPPSAPFSTVWYHTLVNMVDALKMQNRLEEAAQLEQRAESVRGTALQSQLNTVASTRFKFRNTKQEASRMIRNRKYHSRGEWWYHGLKWIGENVPDFCARLRKGVTQQFDTQFQLMRTHVLQLNVTSVEDVIDKLDLDLTRMDTARTEAMTLAKTPVPTSGAHISDFYDTLDQTDDVLYAYQQLLVRDIEVDGISGIVQTKVLNLAERLLLFIEYVLVDRHNVIMQVYRFQPETVSAEDETTLFQLARWLLLAEASFRELELMKIELAHAQAYNKTKRDFASSLHDLEHSALPHCDLPEEDAGFDESTNQDSPFMDEDGTRAEGSETEKVTGDAMNQAASSSSSNPALNPTDVQRSPTYLDSDHVAASASSRNVKTIETDLVRFGGARESRLDHQLAPLRKRVDSAISNCIALKHQLEFVLESGREKLPRMEVFGSKISAVARKLIEVLQDTEEMQQNPAVLRNKALVFSKWSEPLIQLSVLLRENGIQYNFGKDAGVEGGRIQGNLAQRLASFRDDPDVKVLLLNSKSQSTGLTLTQANHVFLLEDVESAHELQAIGRAHRIGQTRVTHIWKAFVRPGEFPNFSEEVDLISEIFSPPSTMEY